MLLSDILRYVFGFVIIHLMLSRSLSLAVNTPLVGVKYGVTLAKICKILDDGAEYLAPNFSNIKNIRKVVEKLR